MIFSDSTSVAVVGDSIDAGGHILSSDAHMHQNGMPVAVVGSPAQCAVHGMTHVAEGSARMTVNGKRVAVDGDRLACGHRIVVNRQARAKAAGDQRDRPAQGARPLPPHPAPTERPSTQPRSPSTGSLSQYLKVVRPDDTPLAGIAFLKWTACGARVDGRLSGRGTSEPIYSDRPGFVNYAFEAPQAEPR